MAFENVFGNIDFQANNKMRMDQNSQFNQLLGQAIAAEQQAQEMEIKRRQMEMKENEFNLGKAAENAAIKLELGMDLTPQERAALNVKSKISPPAVYTDQFGNQVVRPSGWANYGGRPAGMGTPFNPDPTQQLNYDAQLDQMMPPQSPSPDGARLSIEDLQGFSGQIPPLDAMELEGGLPVPYQGQRDVVSDDYQQPEFKAGGMIANTPKGEIMEQEFKKDVNLAQAKADIQFRKEQMKSEKGKQKVTKTIKQSMQALEEINDKLKAKQAIINNDQGILDNLKNKYGTSWLGRQTTSVTAPEIETLRKNYETTRDSLIPSYIAYFELPSTVVDTEEFQQRILQSFGDPSLTYEANKSALDNMIMQFGLEKNEGSINQTQQQPAQANGWSIKRK
jgi:hypothetical protein